LVLLLQLELMQIRGSVNLNYYIMFLLSVLQDKHKKFPYINSGLTSVVLVIVPEIETNFPIYWVFISLIFWIASRFLIAK